MTVTLGLRKKLLIGLILSLVLLSGCLLWAEEDEPVLDAEPEEEPATEQVVYPITVIDDSGQEVTIESQPERVICFAPSNTEILFSLGVGDRIVGIDDYSNWPEEEVADLPSVGGPMNPNFEIIASLEPEVFFTIAGMDEIAAQLRDLGVTVVVLQPKDFQGIYGNIQLVGEIMGVPAEAQEVIDYMRSEVERIEEVLGGLSEGERVSVFYEVWGPEPLMTTGPGTFIDYMITVSGGVNIAADVSGEWVEFSNEELVERDPDVILTTLRDTILELEGDKRSGWDRISAVQNERYYRIDPDIVSRPSPRLIEGLRVMAQLLHPDLFE